MFANLEETANLEENPLTLVANGYHLRDNNYITRGEHICKGEEAEDEVGLLLIMDGNESERDRARVRGGWN